MLGSQRATRVGLVLTLAGVVTPVMSDMVKSVDDIICCIQKERSLTETYEARLVQLLTRAGLALVDDRPLQAALSPAGVWRQVARADVRPEIIINLDADGALLRVNEEWNHALDRLQIPSEDGSFLIHVAGHGSFAFPWKRVRISGVPRLAEELGSVRREPEFVTMAEDGHAICAVTTEEDGVWIICQEDPRALS
jgi:hypothetical protein